MKDTCYASDAQGGPQDDLFCTGTPAQWQYYSHMRWVAGWPMELDTFKCRLKPLDRMDYVPLGFTDEEWAKLNQAFPTGVCDFSKPAVAKQPSIPWITFADGPGGRPLGDPPTSQGPPARFQEPGSSRPFVCSDAGEGACCPLARASTGDGAWERDRASE